MITCRRGVVAGEFPPLLPCRAQHEAKIMNLIVVLTFLDEPAVVLGASLPVAAESQLIEEPHLTAQEAFAPVGPGFSPMLPVAVVGIEREVAGVVGSQSQHFPGGDLERSSSGRLRRLLKRQAAAFLDSPRIPVHGSLPHFSPTPPTQEGACAPVRMIVLLCSMYSSIAVRPSSRPMPEAP